MIDECTGVGYSATSLGGNSTLYGTTPGGGVFDSAYGSFVLNVNARPAVPGTTQLTYTLEFDQFVTYPPGTTFPYTGALVVSGVSSSPTVTQLATHGSEGYWYSYLYTWSGTPGAGPLHVTVAPDYNIPNTSDIGADRIVWTINGDLVPVPEPALAGSLTAAGLAIFAVWRLRRRAA